MLFSNKRNIYTQPFLAKYGGANKGPPKVPLVFISRLPSTIGLVPKAGSRPTKALPFKSLIQKIG